MSRRSRRGSRPGRGVWLAGLVLAVLSVGPLTALAGHMYGWNHDHGGWGVPYRPDGYQDFVRVFGSPCSGSAAGAATWFPHAVGRWHAGYVYYHPYLARNVGYNIRNHIEAAHRNNAIDYGVYGYYCRAKTGGSGYSTHAWGAAIDTNTARNPYGQCGWNGTGADGANHGLYIPDVYRGQYPGHFFRWGRDWCDPHHFQYVTNY